MNLGKRVVAVMSMPRVAFTDNMFCALQAACALGLRFERFTGAFWGQCLERVLSMHVESNGHEFALCCDFDTLFLPSDVEALVALADADGSADAVFAVQSQRLTGKVCIGMAEDRAPTTDDFAAPTTPVALGNFGLCLLRIAALRDVPHPWFMGIPNERGRWDGDHVDDDGFFWRKWHAHGKTVCQANRVVVGHMEAMVTWPRSDGSAIYQHALEFWNTGRPVESWQ